MGTLKVNGTVTATKFVGSLQGNADTASSLKSSSHLTTVDAMNNFVYANEVKFATFKLSEDANGLGFGSNDGMLLSIPWSSTTYAVQLAVDDAGRKISIRSKSNTWTDWARVLTSANYTDYTVTKTGSGASGTWGINITGSAGSVAWGNVTGKPSSFTPSSHTHSYIDYTDTRNDNQSPNDLQAGLTIHLKGNSTDGLSDGLTYHAVIGIKDWGDYSGGPYGQLAITANNAWFRNSSSGTAWNSWRKILDSSNYTSYTVTKTGSGASGTWSINVTGSASKSSYTTYDDTNIAYAGWSNELNFGGSNSSSTIYFGYRAVDSKPIPTNFVFGGSSGTATITAANFTGTWQGNSPSAFASASHGHSSLSALVIDDNLAYNVIGTHSGGGSDYDKALLSTLCSRYPNYGGNFSGRYWPNAYGFLLGNIYNTSITSGGLPQYSTFIGSNLGDAGPRIFGTSSYNYYAYTLLTSGNYSYYALPLSGGTMTGTIITPGNDASVIRPSKNNYDQIGASDYLFWKMFATYGHFNYVVTTNYGTSAPTSTALPVGTIYYKI